MTSQTIYKEHLSEPWFTLVSLGLKTYEGRLCKNRFHNYKEGDIIKWVNDDFGKERFCLTQITNITIYETFEEYLNDKGLENCLPGMPSLDHGLCVYFKYFTKEDEEKYGVVSFELEKMNYCLTLILNGNPDGYNYVKKIDDAYHILDEYNKNYDYYWNIDKTYVTFENGRIYMLKQKFQDIEFIFDDLKYHELQFNDLLQSSGDSKIFKNIQTTYHKETDEDISEELLELIESASYKLLGIDGKT